MDAFTHCVESYLSTTFHPICDGIAVEGLRYISKGLETAVRDGANGEARTAMMMERSWAESAFTRGSGSCTPVPRAGLSGASPPRNTQCDPAAARTPV